MIELTEKHLKDLLENKKENKKFKELIMNIYLESKNSMVHPKQLLN